MHLGFLDKSPHMAPLLVRLYDSQKLHSLAEDKRPLARAELTNAVSELLETHLSPREVELVADVLIELMRQAELDLRIALSERLAHIDNAPLRLVLQMVNDQIEVAGPMLEHSSVLSDLDLIYFLKSKPAEYWRFIARRRDLTGQVIDDLSETKDLETCISLVENTSIKLPERSISILCEMAKSHDDLSRPLSARSDIPKNLTDDLYSYVGDTLKDNLNSVDGEAETYVETVIDEIKAEYVQDYTVGGDIKPTPDMIKMANNYAAQGQLTLSAIMGTLRRGQFQTFVAQFSKFSGVDHGRIEAVLRQPTGQALAIVCKALRIEKQDFVTIFLLTNKLRSVNKTADVKGLGRVVNYFNTLDESVSQKVLEFSLDDFLNA